jgi:hypothetical protein
MALIVPDEGEIELLKKLLILTTDTETYSVKLFQNNYIPSSSTTAADFTEADFDGYAPVTLNRSDWSTPTIDISSDALSTAPSQSWTCGTFGNTIFGYYVLGSTSGKVLWSERLSVARVLNNNDVLHVSPIFTLKSAN